MKRSKSLYFKCGKCSIGGVSTVFKVTTLSGNHCKKMKQKPHCRRCGSTWTVQVTEFHYDLFKERKKENQTRLSENLSPSNWRSKHEFMEGYD